MYSLNFPESVSHRSGERFKIICLFCYTFLTSGAYVVGRAAADSLFLSRIGSAQLPKMYLLSAGLLILCSVVYGSLARRFALKSSVLVCLGLLVSSSLLGYGAILYCEQSAFVLVGLYLLAELRGGLNTIHYKTLTSDLLPHDCRRRTVGILGASATLAAIVLGGVCAYCVRQLGTPQLLCITAGLELLAAIPISLLSHLEPDQTSIDEPTPDERPKFFDDSGQDLLLRSSSQEDRNRSRLTYIGSIGALMASMVMVSTFIEYQWKVSGAASFAGKEDELAAYFGLFYVVVNVLTGAVQLLLTGRVLRSIGTHYSLIVLPVALLAGISTIAFNWSTHGLFVVLTCLKGCDVIKRGINNPALLMLYSPLNASVRRRAIVWITGIVKPFSEAASAIIILLLAHYGTPELLVVAIVIFLVCWIRFAIRILPAQSQLCIKDAIRDNDEQHKRLFQLLETIEADYNSEAIGQDPTTIGHIHALGTAERKSSLVHILHESP